MSSRAATSTREGRTGTREGRTGTREGRTGRRISGRGISGRGITGRGGARGDGAGPTVSRSVGSRRVLSPRATLGRGRRSEVGTRGQRGVVGERGALAAGGGRRQRGRGTGVTASALVPRLSIAKSLGRRGTGRGYGARSRAHAYSRVGGLHYYGSHRHHGHHHSQFRHGFYGHYAYPYGFSFGISLGSYGYGSYPYYSSLHVGFPYVGYYHRYPYAYFSPYGYDDCGFYSTGFYLRYGPYRRSYFSVCSGLGSHAYGQHHHHREPCSVHGAHYYHARDCNLCDPGASSYAYHEVEVPPTDSGAVASTYPGSGDVAHLGPTSPDSSAEPPPQPADEFFSKLKPAQLSVAFGLMHFKNGDYDKATEEFYNSSIEDPESPLVKVLLGVALFSTGEYRYAAGYFRRGLEEWPEFPRYDWRLQDLYGNDRDFQKHSDLLGKQLELVPSDDDTLLVSALTGFFAGEFDRVGPQFALLRTFGRDPAGKALASEYLSEIAARHDTEIAPHQAGEGTGGVRIEPAAFRAPPAADDPVAAFLSRPGLDRIEALPIR